MLSRLKELDSCGLFLTEWQPDLDYYSVKKKSAQVQLLKAWENFKIARGYGTIRGYPVSEIYFYYVLEEVPQNIYHISSAKANIIMEVP